jgi:NADH-quinone oxidoreductase subunit J
MTSKPELRLGGHLLSGLAAVALFVVLAVTFLNAEFAEPAAGFDPDASITASIGYALFDLTSQAAVSSEGFLAAFIIIAFVLDAALDGAVFLAIREEGGRVTDALRVDGGSEDGAATDEEGGDR